MTGTIRKNPLLGLYGKFELLDPTSPEAQLAKDLRLAISDVVSSPVETTIIRSSRRSSRQAVVDGQNYVVVDLSQVSLMAISDLVLTSPDCNRKIGELLGSPLFAEQFRQYWQNDRALVHAAYLRQNVGIIRNIKSNSAYAPRSRAMLAFVLSHEFAHFSIDAKDALAEDICGQARAALREHCDANKMYREKILAGAELPKDVEASVQRAPDEAREVMARQISSYLGHVEGDTQVLRESSCDFLAVLFLVAWQGKISTKEILRGHAPRLSGLQLGDAIMLAWRAARLLMHFEMIASTARHISLDVDPTAIEIDFARITARHNITTNLYIGLYERLLERMEPAAARERLAKGFRQSIEILRDRSTNSLFAAVEMVGLLNRDAEDFNKVKTGIWADAFPEGPPSEDQITDKLSQWLDETEI